MIVDVTEPVLDYRNQPLIDETSDTPITMRDVIGSALGQIAPGEQPAAEHKAKAFEISVKIFASDKVELTVEEAAFIKARSGLSNLSPLVYGRICAFIEGTA